MTFSQALRTALFLILSSSIAASAAVAQDTRGFIGAAMSSNVNQDHYAGVGGGVTIDLGTPWVSGGGQGEALISWPYFAGRGALFAQANLPNRSQFRPLMIGGIGMGEDAGPLVGAGVDMRQRGTRYGFRLTVEDYVVRYVSYETYLTGHTVTRTGHQLAVRGSLLF